MTGAEPQSPPPPPPPPPPGYQASYGLPAPAPAPPPRPEIDPDLLRPSKAWYWVAGAIGGAAFLTATVLSILNTITAFDNLGNDPGTSALAWAIQIGGIGAAAVIGGITWSRRNEHKRRLQHDEMVRQGLI
jgi:hypothetical protein